jgi:hypothetical protein
MFACSVLAACRRAQQTGDEQQASKQGELRFPIRAQAVHLPAYRGLKVIRPIFAFASLRNQALDPPPATRWVIAMGAEVGTGLGGVGPPGCVTAVVPSDKGVAEPSLPSTLATPDG